MSAGKIETVYNELHVGAEQPFKLVHISDTHLAMANDMDNERKRELAARRFTYFTPAEEWLAHGVKTAREENALLIHTGDLLDFTSEENFRLAKKFADENENLFFVAGNHEFSQYVGETVEDAAYREQSLAAVQACFNNDIRFDSKIQNGVNIVGIDNGYYLFESSQFSRLKAEVDKGLPIILCFHNPIYTPALHKRSKEAHGEGNPSYLVGVPEEEMAYYSESRYKQQKADALTYEVCEYIKSQPLIKAVLCGHIHRDVEDMLTPTKPQLVTGIGTARVITVK